MLIFWLFQKKYENLKKVCLDGCMLISNAGIKWLSDIIDGATQLEQVKYRSNLLWNKGDYLLWTLIIYFMTAHYRNGQECYKWSSSVPDLRPYDSHRFLARLTRRVMWAIAIPWRPLSVRKHFNLLLENHWSKWDQTWQEYSFSWSNQVLLLSLRSVIQHGCQGP